MTEVRIHHLDVGTTTLSVSLAAPVDEARGTVVLLHDVPEIGYSWRHQIRALAAAGWRVLAPDQRGCGWSDAPDGPDAYGLDALVGDVVGLLDVDAVDAVDAAGPAVVVGHGWGGVLAERVAVRHPDRVRALGLLSLPGCPFDETETDTLFGRDAYGTLRTIYWGACAARPEGHRFGDRPPKGLPPYLEAGEFENYVRAFMRSGFAKPLEAWRSLHHAWATADRPHDGAAPLPTVHIRGERWATSTEPDRAGRADLHFVSDAGHWVQQEAPDAVSDLLLNVLEEVA